MNKLFGKVVAVGFAAMLVSGSLFASSSCGSNWESTTTGTTPSIDPTSEVGTAIKDLGALDATKKAELDTIFAGKTTEEIKAIVQQAIVDAPKTGSAGATAVAGAAISIAQGGQAKVSARVAAVAAAVKNAPIGAAGPAASNGGWDVWGSHIMSFGDQDGFGGRNGYEYDAQGMMLGVDKVLGNFIVGANVAFVDTDVDVDNVAYESDVDTWTFGVYGAFNTNSWYVETGASYGTSDIDNTRKLTTLNRTATSETDARTYSGFVNAGYHFLIGDKLVLTPHAGLSYTYGVTDGYKESGAGLFDMETAGYDTDAFVSTIGGRATYAVTSRVSVEGRGSYSYDMIDEWTKVKTRVYKTTNNWTESKGLEPDADSFKLGAGINGQLTDALSLSVNYDWETKKKFDSHTVVTGLRFEW